MTVATANVPTASAAKYLQQLCKHWAHKLDVEFTAEQGTVRFPDGVATLKAGPEVLTVSIEAQDPATVERLEQVVASHLDRFAFREAPLAFNWA